MTSLLDMSLDEQILKSKRENKGTFRRNNRKSNYSRDVHDQWKHDKYEDNNRDRRHILSRIGGRHGQNNDKSAILITNLHWEVSENDLKSLFEKVGEINKVRIKYDKAGRSDGEATIVFNSSSAARKAIDKYDGVELDGMEMSIKIDDSYLRRNNNDSKRSGRGSILSRLGQGKGFKNRQSNRSNNKNSRNSRRREHKETVTKEMLDEEMDRYMSNEMDVEENNDGSNEITSSRNIVSYVDEDEPVKGDINSA